MGNKEEKTGEDATWTPEIRSQIIAIYKLKYVQNNHNKLALAQALNIQVEVVESLIGSLDRYLIERIGKITLDRLPFVCEDCLGTRMIEDNNTGDRVCPDCGVVDREPVHSDDSLGFDTSFKPSSDLAVGKSMGGTLSIKDQKSIQRHNSNDVLLRELKIENPQLAEKLIAGGDPLLDGAVIDGGFIYRFMDEKHKTVRQLPQAFYVNAIDQLFHSADIAYRAKRIQMMTSQESQYFDSLLYGGFDLAKMFHLDVDYVFEHSLGGNIRKAIRMVKDYGLDITKDSLVQTVFLYTLLVLKKSSVAEEASRRLDKIDVGFLVFIVQMSHLATQMSKKGYQPPENAIHLLVRASKVF